MPPSLSGVTAGILRSLFPGEEGGAKWQHLTPATTVGGRPPVTSGDTQGSLDAHVSVSCEACDIVSVAHTHLDREVRVFPKKGQWGALRKPVAALPAMHECHPGLPGRIRTRQTADLCLKPTEGLSAGLRVWEDELR